jgi:hypothetical protein
MEFELNETLELDIDYTETIELELTIGGADIELQDNVTETGQNAVKSSGIWAHVANAISAAITAIETWVTANFLANTTAYDYLKQLSTPIVVVDAAIIYENGWIVNVEAIGGLGDFTATYTVDSDELTLIVTDSVGNSATKVISLTSPITISEISYTWNIDGTEATIEVTASGGWGNLFYRINGGAWQPSNEFIVTEVDTYTIEVRDEPEINTQSDTVEVEPKDEEATILAEAYIDRVMAEPYSLIAAGITSEDWQDVTFDEEGAPNTNYNAEQGKTAIIALYQELLDKGQEDDLDIFISHLAGVKLYDDDGIWRTVKVFDLSVNDRDMSNAVSTKAPALHKDGFLHVASQHNNLTAVGYKMQGGDELEIEFSFIPNENTANGQYIFYSGVITTQKGLRLAISTGKEFRIVTGDGSGVGGSATIIDGEYTDDIENALIISWDGKTGGDMIVTNNGVEIINDDRTLAWEGDSNSDLRLGARTDTLAGVDAKIKYLKILAK